MHIQGPLVALRSAILKCTCALATLGGIGAPIASAQTAPPLAGEWRLEFRSEPSPTDSAVKSAPWLNFTAVVVQVDSAIGGSMRSDGPTGQFGCKRRGSEECSAGRMRLSWDEQDWQVFEFKLTPGATDRGTGKAEIRFPNGSIDRYSFTMTRLR